MTHALIFIISERHMSTLFISTLISMEFQLHQRMLSIGDIKLANGPILRNLDKFLMKNIKYNRYNC